MGLEGASQVRVRPAVRDEAYVGHVLGGQVTLLSWPYPSPEGSGPLTGRLTVLVRLESVRALGGPTLTSDLLHVDRATLGTCTDLGLRMSGANRLSTSDF